MARFQEDLSGGWVTSKDPALLAPGQLSNVRNATYHARTGSALSRAFGRSIFGSASAASAEVDGLRDIQFDNGDHYLVAMVTGADAKYRYASISATGTTAAFTDLATITAGTQLEAIHYNNRFFLLNGVTGIAGPVTSSNRVVYMSASAVGTPLTARQHGMLAVSAAPGSASSLGTFSQTVTGYYEYWTTEIAKLFQDSAEITLESTFDSSAAPLTVFVSSLNLVPQIQMPAPLNSITTHWGIYRSPKKDKESDKKFPTGFKIGELATASAGSATFFPDTLTTASASSFPTSAISFGSPFGLGQFTSASAMFSDNGVYASGANTVFTTRVQGVAGFNLGGFTGNIKGIAVELDAYIPVGAAPVPLTVTIGPKDPNAERFAKTGFLGITTKTASLGNTVTATSPGQILTFGGPTSLWLAPNGPQFVDSELNSGNFMVAVSFSKPNTTVGIDYVKLFAYYGASFDSVVPFPTVVYTFGDIVAQVGKNGPPPAASTGDMFEDCLVINSANEPALIRWSYPGLPESFPATYFIDFETRDNDVVRLVKTVNNRLIVGLDNSLWRVNYLPSERDASFDRGKAIEALSKQYGVVNPMCACTFTLDGGNEELAFVSHKGIHSTDGAVFYDRGGNLDWRDVVPLGSNTRNIALINDAENARLLFFYQNDAEAPESFKRIDFFYGKGSIDAAGNFTVGGRVHMRNFNAAGGGFAALKSACSAPTTEGGTTLFYGYGGASAAAGAGQVFYETGNTIPAQDPSFGYSTRRMFLAGYGNEWRMNQLYGFTTVASSANGVAPTASYQATDLKTNAFVTADRGTGRAQVGGQGIGFHRVPFQVASEGMVVNMSITTGVNEAFSEEFLVIDGDGWDIEDSGK
jgi:hypothetical protein